MTRRTSDYWMMRGGRKCGWPDCGCCFDAKCGDAPDTPAPKPDLMEEAGNLRRIVERNDNLRADLAIKAALAAAEARGREECLALAQAEADKMVAYERRRGFTPETATPALHRYQCERIVEVLRAAIRRGTP